MERHLKNAVSGNSVNIEEFKRSIDRVKPHADEFKKLWSNSERKEARYHIANVCGSLDRALELLPQLVAQREIRESADTLVPANEVMSLSQIVEYVECTDNFVVPCKAALAVLEPKVAAFRQKWYIEHKRQADAEPIIAPWEKLIATAKQLIPASELYEKFFTEHEEFVRQISPYSVDEMITGRSFRPATVQTFTPVYEMFVKGWTPIKNKYDGKIPLPRAIKKIKECNVCDR